MRFLTPLFIIIALAALMGVGCKVNNNNAKIKATQQTISNIKPAPTSAYPSGLTFGGELKSAVLIQSLQKAINTDPNTQVLIKKLKQLGFDWSPKSSDFVAELDNDKSSLVGIAYRRDLENPTSTAWLVALYPLTSKKFDQPKYIYLVTYTHSSSSPLIRYWVENKKIESREELPSGQETYKLPNLQL